MKITLIKIICCSLLMAMQPFTAYPADEVKPPKENAQVSAQTRLNRIDFGNSYIIGQTIKSGAVYLLQRKKTEMKSMLKFREDYRKEILEDHSFGDQGTSVKEADISHVKQ